MKAFEARGYWYLPTAPDDKVAGTLRFSQEDGICLSLTGSLSDFSSLGKPASYPMVHGVVSQSPYGKCFTLLECHQSHQTIGMPGITTEEIWADRAYASRVLLSEEDLRFDAFRVSLAGLLHWLGISGVRHTRGREDGARHLNLEYIQPPSIEAAARGKPLRIGFDCSLSHGDSGFALREDAWIYVDGLSRLAEDQIGAEYLHPLLNFFAFATDGPGVVEEYALFRDAFTEHQSEYDTPIYVLRQPLYVPREASRREFPHDMLFTYQDVNGSFPDMLNRWFEFSRKFDALCAVYFSSLYRPGAYVEDRFLNPIRALVFYFQESQSASEGVQGVRQRAIAELQMLLHLTEETWLSQSVSSEAEIMFPVSLFRALEEHQHLMKPLIGDNSRAFVDAVLAKLSAINRRDGRMTRDPLDGADLYWTSERLRVLLKACILEEIGIPRDDAYRYMRRNKIYRNLKANV